MMSLTGISIIRQGNALIGKKSKNNLVNSIIMKVLNYKGNRIIINKIIPFKGTFCWNLFGVIFVRDVNEGCLSHKDPFCRQYIDSLLNHANIHTEQMRDWFGWINKKFRNSIINTILGGIIFYMWYLIEWGIRLPEFFIPPILPYHIYRDISFEQEAIINEDNFDYINIRKPFNWTSRIFKSSWFYE